MSTAQPAVRQDKYSSEKTTFGGVTYVTMHGTLNEAFEGKKLATSIRTKKLIISMRDIRRFASWGMSEWMDFLRITSDCDLYLVECSTYSVSQLNLVTGLMGHAKLVSFYASYRCGSCSEELQTLFLIPSDRVAIRDIPGSHQECPTCGGRARLEEYPAAFFDTIASRPSFDIDDEALAWMRSHLNYDLSPDLTRFRAYGRVLKGYNYIRLTGNIGSLPPAVLAKASEGTTIIDLEHIVFDPAQVGPWRTYLQTVMPKVQSLQLLGCPPDFLEATLHPEDLRNKLKVRTFTMVYDCGTCDTTTTHVVDVAHNLEDLVRGVPPAVRCPSCRSALVAPLTEERIALMRALPARDRDVALDAFLARVRAEPVDRLDNCLIASPTAPAATPGRRALYLAAGLGVLLVGGLVMISVKLWTDRPAPAAPVTDQVVAPSPPEHPFTRPDWIIADVPASAYCHDMINRLMCVGISAYRTSRDDGVAEATDAALEELVNAVGLKISEPFFRDTVVPAYSDVRAKALSTLQAAALDRANDAKTAAAYMAADEVVRNARKRVVETLQATGGAAVPVQRSDWYWEQYNAPGPVTGTEFLVFVRFDVSLDAVRSLVDKYSANTPVLSASTTTAFPALAWRRASFKGGAFVTKVDKPIAGLAPQSIVIAVGDQHITDASGLAKRVEDAHATGKVELTVQSLDGTETVVHTRP